MLHKMFFFSKFIPVMTATNTQTLSTSQLNFQFNYYC